MKAQAFDEEIELEGRLVRVKGNYYPGCPLIWGSSLTRSEPAVPEEWEILESRDAAGRDFPLTTESFESAVNALRERGREYEAIAREEDNWERRDDR